MSDSSQLDVPVVIESRVTTRMGMVGRRESSSDAPMNAIGRYEIIEVLGTGAMGIVYKARDPLLDRVVAVKTIMTPDGVSTRSRHEFVRRFEREAKAAAKLHHPSIVTIFDVGVADRRPFMVLEYLPGESLADRLDLVRMPLARAVRIAIDLASALALAHRQGIVHRDVKPSNVLHAGLDRWKLSDFGIARMPGSDLTQIGTFIGTPGYSPPEAVERGQYTVQADVFAWGAVLYELLSGRVPYNGTSALDINHHVLAGKVRDIREYDSSIPDLLADVAMQALNHVPCERYPDAVAAEAALCAAWDACLNTQVVHLAGLKDDEVPHEQVGECMHADHSPAISGPAEHAETGESSLDHDIAEFEEVTTKVFPQRPGASIVFGGYLQDDIVAFGRAPTAPLSGSGSIHSQHVDPLPEVMRRLSSSPASSPAPSRVPNEAYASALSSEVEGSDTDPVLLGSGSMPGWFWVSLMLVLIAVVVTAAMI